jgi:hypothetical protein
MLMVSKIRGKIITKYKKKTTFWHHTKTYLCYQKIKSIVVLSLLSDSQGIVLYGSADKRALIQVVALGWYSIESQFKWYSIAVLIKYIPFKAYGSANKRKPVCITDISSTDKES